MSREPWSANRVDAACDEMQPAAGEPVLNRLTTQSEVEQLPTGNHPMLVARKPPDILCTRRSID
jgi:hypothetical protein